MAADCRPVRKTGVSSGSRQRVRHDRLGRPSSRTWLTQWPIAVFPQKSSANTVNVRMHGSVPPCMDITTMQKEQGRDIHLTDGETGRNDLSRGTAPSPRGSPASESGAAPASLLLLSPSGSVAPGAPARPRPRRSAPCSSRRGLPVARHGRPCRRGGDRCHRLRRRRDRHAGHRSPPQRRSGRFRGRRRFRSQAVMALNLGADDFVMEPFENGEVPARIRSVLRRCRRPGRPSPLDVREAVGLPSPNARFGSTTVSSRPRPWSSTCSPGWCPHRGGSSPGPSSSNRSGGRPGRGRAPPRSPNTSAGCA